MYAGLGRWEEAVESFGRFLEVEKEAGWVPWCQLSRAVALHIAGDEKAAADLAASIADKPGPGDFSMVATSRGKTWPQPAFIAYMAGYFARDCLQCDDAVVGRLVAAEGAKGNTAGENSLLRYMQGSLLRERGDYEDALRVLQEALDMDGALKTKAKESMVKPWCYMELADVQQRLGAADSVVKGLLKKSEACGTKYEMAQICAQRGKRVYMALEKKKN